MLALAVEFMDHVLVFIDVSLIITTPEQLHRRMTVVTGLVVLSLQFEAFTLKLSLEASLALVLNIKDV